MTIELNDKQARLIAEALEEHSRVLCGQIELSKMTSLETSLYIDADLNDEFWQRRDDIDYTLLALKRLVFPELLIGASYGVGKFPEADLGYEMYKQILYTFEKRKMNDNDYISNVHSYQPLKLTDEPIIKIKDE